MRANALPQAGLASDVGVAYALLRLTMGVNFFVHGASRLPHLAAFVATTGRDFEKTALPAAVVVAFAYAIPFIEVVLGGAIAVGIGTRVALAAAALYMIALMFGTLLRAEYLVVTEQLVYSLAFAGLIALRSFDRFSLDSFGARRSVRPVGAADGYASRMATHQSTKVSTADASRGSDGDFLLARGDVVGLRLWKDEAPGVPKAAATRDYETVGYVISGRADLHLDESVTHLEAGDSWVVPAGVSHRYEIVSAFTAVEATSPPPATT